MKNKDMQIAKGGAGSPGNIDFYRKKWREHQNGTNVIKDKHYLKELQQIILYPDRFGFKDV